MPSGHLAEQSFEPVTDRWGSSRHVAANGGGASRRGHTPLGEPGRARTARGDGHAYHPLVVLMFKLSALILLVHCLSLAMSAQNTGTLGGVVEDASGAAVPQAQLKLRSKAGGAEFTATSNETGRFIFTGILVDQYVLIVKAEGFAERQLSIKVAETPAPALRIRLELAAVTAEITVTDEDLEAPSAAGNRSAIRVGQHWLDSLPVQDGDLLAVPSLFLNPGTVGFGGPQIIVDGEVSSNLDFPTSGIKRIYVNNNPYSAEFGSPGGGRIEVVTQNGSPHHYHRKASVILQNSALNARDAFARARPTTQRSIFEGAFDGPLRGERLTFLLAGRYFKHNESAVVNAQTPADRLVENVATPKRGWRLFGRMDLRWRPTHTLRLNYKFKDTSAQHQGVGGFNLPEHGTDAFDREHKVTFSESSIFSSNTTNDIRVSFKREWQTVSSLTDRPAVIVLDSFSSGGAQISKQRRDSAVSVQEVASLVRGKHTLHFGGDARLRSFLITDASNFGGTFLFSSLSTFLQNRPFLFQVNRGNPRVSFAQNEFAYFLQDEIRLRPDFSISLGWRHELQSNLADYTNFAPRLTAVYAPGNRQTVFTLGAGAFYERQPALLTHQSLLLDGLRIRQAVIENPSFPMPSNPGGVSFPTPSIVRLAPGIRAPYLAQTSFGVERRLGAEGSYLAVEYELLRGLRLFRTRNVNAPLPGPGLRPDPNFININQFESSGKSRGHSLRITWNMAVLRNLDFLSQYTLSRIKDDTDGPLSLPANNYDLRSEYGRADFDRLHNFTFVGMYRLPRRAKIGAIAHLASGIPFNITTGFDDNGDTVANDRPPGVGRNTGKGPGLASLDVRLSKKIRFGRDRHWPRPEIRLDAFNVLNQVNFTHFVGTLASPFFGRANSAYPARQLQLSLKLEF